MTGGADTPPGVPGLLDARGTPIPRRPTFRSRVKGALRRVRPVYLFVVGGLSAVALIVTNLETIKASWAGRKASHDVLDSSLEHLGRKDSSSRLRGIKELAALAKSDADAHWRLVEVLPDLVRSWTFSGRAIHDVNMPTDTLEAARRVARGIERPEILAALRTLTGRKGSFEAEGLLPEHLREALTPNRSGLSGSLSGFREWLLAYIRDWQFSVPDSEKNFPRQREGTNLPEVPDKRWLNLERIDVAFSNLARLNLPGTKLARAGLFGTDLTEVDFRKCDLERAMLDRATLWDADLREAMLPHASMRRTDLGKADLRDAWLLKANLQGANLYHAKLDGCFLMLANLQQLDILAGASARGANLWRANLCDAILTHTGRFLSVANVQALLDSQQGNSEELANHRLHLLREARSDRVDLRGACLREACLQGALLWNIDLAGADFTEARLSGTFIVDVDLSLVVGLTYEQLVDSNLDSQTVVPSYLGQEACEKLAAHAQEFDWSNAIQQFEGRKSFENIDADRPFHCDGSHR